MTDKGLKIVSTFTKKIDDNKPRVEAHVTIEHTGVVNRYQLMKQAIGDYACSIYHTFDTAAQAKHWAEIQAEKIRVEYAATIARIDAVEIPEDFEVYG